MVSRMPLLREQCWRPDFRLSVLSLSPAPLWLTSHPEACLLAIRTSTRSQRRACLELRIPLDISKTGGEALEMSSVGWLCPLCAGALYPVCGLCIPQLVGLWLGALA